MNIALFGGSFDPPHLGHQMAMLYALAMARVERLVMVPCFCHPFDKNLSPFEHRLAMARLAAEPFGERVEVSDIERQLGGPSRTLRTVAALAQERLGTAIALVVGSDLLAEREHWFAYEELQKKVRFVVVPRAGYDTSGPLAIPDVSSTEIRERVARGEVIADRVAAPVADYIVTHRLYRP